MYGRMNIYAHRRRARKHNLVLFLVILALAAVLALGISVYWGKLQQQQEELTAQVQNDTGAPKEVPAEGEEQPQGEQPPEGDAAVTAPVEDEQTQQTATEPTQTQESADTTDSDVATTTDVVDKTSERILQSPALVPNTGKAVDDSYFDDAAFVGDSITEGIKLYEIMSNATVVAARGINLDTVFTDDQIRTAAGYTTVLGALQEAAPKKVYIMFGANGVGWFTEQHFTDTYTEFVEKVKSELPDSQIYLQSILPVTQGFDDERDDISNQKIDQYNELIVQIAEKEGVHYLDVASVFKNDAGCLPDDSNGDGMHFGTKYYNLWFDYLRTHTATEE